MARASAATSLPPTSARSRIGTGRALFLEGVDGRSLLARRYREVLAELLSEIAEPSAAQVHLARRAAALSMWSEDAEARLVAGEAVDIGAFATVANSLRRLLADLPRANELADITPGGRGPGQITVEFVRSDKSRLFEEPSNQESQNA